MCLKLVDYPFKTRKQRSTDMNPMIITSQKLVTDTQTLERKENMHITKENHQNTRGKAERNKEQKSTTKTTKTQITK